MATAGAHPPADRVSGIRGLWLGRLAAEVISALAGAGIRALLLKGPALERLLYDRAEPREYGDVDLLVDPAALGAAEETIRALGFVPVLTDRDFPGHRPLHGHPWERPGGAFEAIVDLHTALPEAHASRDRAWSALTRETDRIPLPGGEAEVLSRPGQALHVSLHAAHHGSGATRPMADLARALDRLDREAWRQAAALAAEVGAEEAMAAGLRLAEAGDLAAELGLPDTAGLELALKSGSAPKLALGMLRLRDADGPAARAGLIAKALVPTPAWLRSSSALARRGRAGLVAAYVLFPFRVAAQLPAAVAALLRARPSSPASRDETSSR